jgi:hypothetical protein
VTILNRAMSNHDTATQKASEAKEQILKAVAERNRWNRSDFNRAQQIAWASLIASAITSIWAASGLGLGNDSAWRLVLAGFSAIPGLMVAVESAFKYSVRSRINAITAYDLQLLISDLDRGADPFEVERKYVEYMKKVEQDFPVGGVSPALQRRGRGVP